MFNFSKERLYCSSFVGAIIHSQVHCLKQELRDCNSVLDIGCGQRSRVQHLNIKDSVGVERFKPYIKESIFNKIHSKYVFGDIMKINFADKSFDAVLMLDVVEHLSKSDGEKLLLKAEQWAKKKVIICTPNGFFSQRESDGNIFQKHLSGWTIPELKNRKYQIHGIHGLKYTNQNKFLYPLWLLSQPFIHYFPQLAFQIFAVKTISEPIKENWGREWEKYNKDPYFKPNRKVLEIIKKCFNQKLKGKKIMELGAGSGSDIVSLTKAGAKGFALDFSEEAIESIVFWAKKKNCKLQIIKAHIQKIPYPNKFFDMVYSVGLMEHFADIFPYLKEQIRVIKPGGFLLIHVPQKYTLYTIAKHLRMHFGTHPFGWETEYSREDLIKLAKKINQKVFCVFGTELDIISKLPEFLQPLCNRFYAKYVEDTLLGEHISLGIGLVLKIND